MKRLLLLSAVFCSMSLNAQESQDDSGSLRYRIYDIPEVSFFVNLYQDDYIGDTLSIDGKEYYFSQSPLKQLSWYMLGQTDNRLVLVSGSKPLPSNGMPDKGYVLHFSIGEDGIARVDRATYNGCIYPEDYNNKPMKLDELFRNKGISERNGIWYADWLDGRYRLNTKQPDRQYQNNNECYIAVFRKGKLVEICKDTDRENFNPPMVDLQEKPEGTTVKDFSPKYVYYKSNGCMQKESVDVTKGKWREKLLKSYGSESFLDKCCVESLGKAWIKE